MFIKFKYFSYNRCVPHSNHGMQSFKKIEKFNLSASQNIHTIYLRHRNSIKKRVSLKRNFQNKNLFLHILLAKGKFWSYTRNTVRNSFFRLKWMISINLPKCKVYMFFLTSHIPKSTLFSHCIVSASSTPTIYLADYSTWR